MTLALIFGAGVAVGFVIGTLLCLTVGLFFYTKVLKQIYKRVLDKMDEADEIDDMISPLPEGIGVFNLHYDTTKHDTWHGWLVLQ